MKKFVSVNAKYFKASQSTKISKHNSRVSDIDYLLDEEDCKYKNTSTVFDDENGGSVNLEEGAGLGGKGTYADNLKKMRAVQASTFQQEFEKLQKKKFRKLRERYNYKKNKNENEIVEMIVSLSEEQALNYLERGFSFDEAIKDYMQEIEKKYGLKKISFQGHFDEGHIDKNGKVHHNIHFHCQFYNFDFEKNKTVLRNLKKKDWSNMQDIAESSFQKYDMNFKRGISKEETGKKHLERIDFIAQEKQNELKELYTTLNKEKNNLKNIRKNFDKDTNKFKVLSTSIKTLQLKEKQAREQARKLKILIANKKNEIGIIEEKVESQEKWLKDTRAELKTFLLEHTQKNKNGKYELKNVNDFYEEIVDLALYLSNYDLKVQELDKQRDINAVLRNRISTIESSTEKVTDELELKKSRVDELVKTKNSLEDENHLYKKFLEKENLEDEYNSFLKKENQQKSQNTITRKKIGL